MRDTAARAARHRMRDAGRSRIDICVLTYKMPVSADGIGKRAAIVRRAPRAAWGKTRVSTRNEHRSGDSATSETRRYHEQAKLKIAGGVNSNVRLGGSPLCFTSGSGSRLTDVDG